MDRDFWHQFREKPTESVSFEMVGETLWYSLRLSAKRIRYRFDKHMPRLLDPTRRAQMALRLVSRIEALTEFAQVMNDTGMLPGDPESFTYLHQVEKEMKAEYEKRFVRNAG